MVGAHCRCEFDALLTGRLWLAATAGDYQAAYGALRFQNIGGVPVGVWGRCAGQGGQGGVLMG